MLQPEGGTMRVEGRKRRGHAPAGQLLPARVKFRVHVDLPAGSVTVGPPVIRAFPEGVHSVGRLVLAQMIRPHLRGEQTPPDPSQSDRVAQAARVYSPVPAVRFHLKDGRTNLLLFDAGVTTSPDRDVNLAVAPD